MLWILKISAQKNQKFAKPYIYIQVWTIFGILRRAKFWKFSKEGQNFPKFYAIFEFGK